MIGIIKPSTILVIFCNVLIFMFMQVLLFWYVISKAIEDIIIDKSSIIRDLISNSTLLQINLQNYIQSEDYQKIYNQSVIDKKTRIDYNMDLTWKWMLIPFLIVIIILSTGIVYTIYVHKYTQYNTLKLDHTDALILTTVLLSFLTEIIFIFVLVLRYIYLSDIDMVIFFMNSNLLPNLLPNLPNLPTFSPFTLPPFTLP